jgi:hypothetical protein
VYLPNQVMDQPLLVMDEQDDLFSALLEVAVKRGMVRDILDSYSPTHSNRICINTNDNTVLLRINLSAFMD